MRFSRNRTAIACLLLLIATLCALPMGPMLGFHPAVRYMLAAIAVVAAALELLKGTVLLARVFVWPNFLSWTLASIGDPERPDGVETYAGSFESLFLMTGITLALLWFMHKADREAMADASRPQS